MKVRWNHRRGEDTKQEVSINGMIFRFQHTGHMYQHIKQGTRYRGSSAGDL